MSKLSLRPGYPLINELSDFPIDRQQEARDALHWNRSVLKTQISLFPMFDGVHFEVMEALSEPVMEGAHG
jgi:hypothetical protein